MSKYLIIDFSKVSPDNNDWYAPGYGEVIHREIISGFYARIAKETDRGLVIVTASLLDDLAEHKLRDLFSHGNDKACGRLFDALGPFSSSASRIDALFCLGAINAESHSNLHVIRKLRNHCAHHWDDFRLDEAVENSFLSKLAIPDFFKNPNGIPSHLPLHPKSKFTAAAFMLVIFLNIGQVKPLASS